MLAWLQGLSGGAATFVGALTGSVLGLVALLLGALFNFQLNRKRDAQLRADEAAAVAAALYGEIILLSKELARVAASVSKIYWIQGYRTDDLAQFNQHFLDRHHLSEPTLYRALAARLGMLPADQVVAIAEFHENYQEVRNWLPMIVENEERSFSYSVLVVLKPACGAINGIETTLRKIENTIGIDIPSQLPDTKEAEQVIEIEEEKFANPD